jgi:hypothetical protein
MKNESLSPPAVTSGDYARPADTAVSLVQSLIANPGLVLRHRNIFLLSHMRANTSLLGHLMGSHPEIEGYYEMHIGYFSWKSLWRQKYLYLSTHRTKPESRYMFDKVLHDSHYVRPELLMRKHSRTLMMLRSPEQSIKSLMTLYRQRRPELPEATAEGATRYYVDRLATLADTAHAIRSRYFYLDAECLITATAPTLAAMSEWLGLQSLIPAQYSTFAKTGHGNSGDDSSRLKSGKVDDRTADYSCIDVPATLMRAAQDAYDRHREQLRAGSDRCVLM